MDESNLLVTLNSVAQRVFADLGAGHSEVTYRNAMLVELRESAIPYESEKIVPVLYKGFAVGHVRLDIVVCGFIIELKALEKIREAEKIQLRKYLRTTQSSVGAVINFGSISVDIWVERAKQHVAESS